MKRSKISLKAGLMATIVICWLVPIAIVVVLAGILLGNSYRQSVRQEVEAAAENAVEHDITARHGGNLWVRAYCREERMTLEVEHDGDMNEEDRQSIRALLAGDSGEQESGVGLRNVHQRLKLIYGEKASLEVTETGEGTILARIGFPAG